MEEERIYLNCPYDDKEECKSLGGRWDGDVRRLDTITVEMASEPFAQWMDGAEPSAGVAMKASKAEEEENAPISIAHFDDKEECKALGGRWDGDAKKWYVPAGKDTVPFAKWL